MTGAKKTILVDVPTTKPWLAVLRQWTSGLGMELDITGTNGIESVQWSDYALVVIGSSMVSRNTSIILLVRRLNSRARIVVFSTCPDWQEARDALLAGAVEYAPMPQDPLSLLKTLEAALDRTPSEHPDSVRNMEFAQ